MIRVAALGCVAILLSAGGALAVQIQGQLYKCSAPLKNKKVWQYTICSDSKTNALYAFVGRIPENLADNDAVRGSVCKETYKPCVYER